jgi:hypothetical protein
VETVAWMDVVSSVSLAIGLAACAGLRAWLPLLLVGGLARADVLTLGSSFGFLASDRALILFGAATLIEIIGDKIPAVDHTLDMLSTVLRPAAGSLIAASVMWEIRDPLTAVAVGVAVGAPSAMVPHAAKSLVRAASTTLTGGLANPVISVIEDVLALAMFVFTVVLPLLAATALLTVGFLVVRRMARRSAPALRTT